MNVLPITAIKVPNWGYFQDNINYQITKLILIINLYLGNTNVCVQGSPSFYRISLTNNKRHKQPISMNIGQSG